MLRERTRDRDRERENEARKRSNRDGKRDTEIMIKRIRKKF